MIQYTLKKLKYEENSEEQSQTKTHVQNICTMVTTFIVIPLAKDWQNPFMVCPDVFLCTLLFLSWSGFALIADNTASPKVTISWNLKGKIISETN
jgi:hypothetical protein